MTWLGYVACGVGKTKGGLQTLLLYFKPPIAN